MQNKFSQRQTDRGQIYDHSDGTTDIRQKDRLTERIFKKWGKLLRCYILTVSYKKKNNSRTGSKHERQIAIRNKNSQSLS